MERAAGAPTAILLWILAPAASAQDAAGVPPAEADAAAQESANGCRGELPPDAEQLDAMRAGLRRGVCSTARFVDRLFGREHEYSEMEDASNGRASMTLGWNEQDEFELDTRFRASVELPAINERFNLTIGRASRDEYVADEQTADGPVIGTFSDDDSAETFAGLGYRVHRDRDSRFDLGAGVKLESPPNPYLNARFRRYSYLRDDLLLTLRTTAFVEADEGFGVTQAFDLDRLLSDNYLLRIGNSVRLSEETDGVRWRSRVALYQAIDYRRALRYELRVSGESGGTEPDLYGFWVTHRRSMFRDWLFLEFGGGVFWADGPQAADRCTACAAASVGFEVLFGDAYDRVLRRERRRAEAADETAPRR